MSNHTVHIFDALPRDKTILRETEDEIEVAYESFDEDNFKGSAQQANKSLVINLFGTKADGTSVTIQVNGFQPFFFVELPPGETVRSVLAVIEKIKKIDVQGELVKRQKLFGFTGGKTFPFAKLSVKSMTNFYDLRKMFLDDNQRPKLSLKKGQAPLRVYESSIDPMLRFFHIQNLQPCGWVSVSPSNEQEQEDGSLLLEVDYDQVKPASAPEGCVTAPFLHGFWDVECYSHDKEFPVAKQGYRRVAKQLWALKSWNEIPEKLVDAFEGTSEIKIPPLKNPKLKPGRATIEKLVQRETFQDTLQSLWDGRDGLLVKEKEARFQKLVGALDGLFGKLAPIAGDPIIQIGTVKIRGQETPEKHIFVLGDCEKIPGAVVHTSKTESELLLAWFTWLADTNFDVLAGYNIFGFDERYVWDRLEELGLEQEECVQQLGRLFYDGGSVKLQEKFLSSSALGDNMLYLWNTPGRLRIDLYGHIKRKVQLNSYKLDAVAAAFLSGKLSGVQKGARDGLWLLKTKQKGDAHVGRFVQVLDDLGEDLTEKMEIVEVASDGIIVKSEEDLETAAAEGVKWAIVKDDVSPQELFRLHREGGPAGRARIANYCIQDCFLVYELYKKLDVFNEAMSMANVCSVPVGYIFTRGQGIKIESLIFKDCRERGQLIEVQPQYHYGKKSDYDVGTQVGILKKLEAQLKAQGGTATAWKFRKDVEKQQGLVDWLLDDATNEDSYEGAIVLDPIPGFYTEAPIGVCDFASLYPSTIISENISHDMLVWTKDFDLEGKFVGLRYGAVEDEANAPPGTHFTDIEFDILIPDPAEAHKKHPQKIRAGTRLCRFAQLANSKKGSLPEIVAKLLAARKAKRAEIGKTDDPFKKALLDAEQNAYKITANSLYGQLGSKTFKIRLQDLAASVTAYARKQIMFSKAAIEKFYGPSAGDPRCSAEVVYGDTDSLFVNFNPRDPAGNRYEGREAVVKTIELTEEAGHFVTNALKAPHDFEYDKVFYPFIIFSKKRYVGNKYEESPDEFKQTSMGIALKRRDNTALLKMAYGGAIDQLLNKRDVVGAVDCVKGVVRDLTDGKLKLSQLTTTRSLAADYAGTPPAHKVLADRIAARDPGNAPSSGDRIAFVYIKPPTGQEASKLQGDRVETPEYIQEKGLKPDAEYYIEHQLRNPLAQLFGLLLEKVPGFKPPKTWSADSEKLLKQRELLAAELLFKEGYVACRSAATKAFIEKIGGSVAKSSGRVVKSIAPPTDPTLKEIAPKKQSLLTSFLRDTAVITDEIAARAMGKAKAEKRKAEKKQAKVVVKDAKST
jgi:DNA polymerase elongation subunit (family B)